MPLKANLASSQHSGTSTWSGPVPPSEGGRVCSTIFDPLTGEVTTVSVPVSESPFSSALVTSNCGIDTTASESENKTAGWIIVPAELALFKDREVFVALLQRNVQHKSLATWLQHQMHASEVKFHEQFDNALWIGYKSHIIRHVIRLKYNITDEPEASHRAHSYSRIGLETWSTPEAKSLLGDIEQYLPGIDKVALWLSGDIGGKTNLDSPIIASRLFYRYSQEQAIAPPVELKPASETTRTEHSLPCGDNPSENRFGEALTFYGGPTSMEPYDSSGNNRSILAELESLESFRVWRKGPNTQHPVIRALPEGYQILVYKSYTGDYMEILRKHLSTVDFSDGKNGPAAGFAFDVEGYLLLYWPESQKGELLSFGNVMNTYFQLYSSSLHRTIWEGLKAAYKTQVKSKSGSAEPHA
ncbi:hypothetical protein NliqN6_1365 [Naganishia liquefaciens]|uniref:Uncharacterized protein n=1 Tax=Naganishia liquefaciens TaxID=104408 RepID=A0A8H3TQB4_9TREE|nr:hypothetical protein NliqN6_1365 [Naganishia liquefaciens]